MKRRLERSRRMGPPLNLRSGPNYRSLNWDPPLHAAPRQPALGRIQRLDHEVAAPVGQPPLAREALPQVVERARPRAHAVGDEPAVLTGDVLDGADACPAQ